MLKTLAASSALKYAAACVCPIAGVTAVTVNAPKVRAAVHKITEPPRTARAKPRARQKPAASTPLTHDESAGRDCLAPAVDFAQRSPVVETAVIDGGDASTVKGASTSR